MGGETRQLAVQERERVGAKLLKRFARNLCGDEGVTIAVAADPIAESEARAACGVVEQRRLKTCLDPRPPQPPVDTRQDLGKDVAKIVNNVAQFRRHVWLFQNDLASPPQPLEQRLDVVAYDFLLRGCVHGVLPLEQQQV